MADQKISELTALTGANVADDDAIAIVDTSATETKKIVFSELKNALDTATGFVRITGDTMTGDLNVLANVGIGTSSPERDLHINGTAANAKAFARFTHDGLASNGLDVGYSSGGYASIYNAENTPMVFSTNATEAMRIDSSGSVGIGTSDPRHILDIEASTTGAIPTNADIGASDENDNYFSFHNASDSATFSGFALETRSSGASRWLIANEWQDTFLGDLVFRVRDGGTSSSEAMRIDSSGSVGIGVIPETWNGLTALQINSQASVSADGSSLQLGVNCYYNSAWKYINTAVATNYYQVGGTHVWRYAASGSADAAISWSEAMRIDSSGNVGIGTSSPSAKLQVAGTTQFGAVGTDGVVQFLRSSDGGAVASVAFQSGTSEVKLNNAISGPMTFYTNNTEAMRLDSSGNLLVGKTSADTYNDTNGIELQASGLLTATRTGIAQILNREDSDGDITVFRKDGSTVGSIGTNSNGNFQLYGTAASHVGLQFGSPSILPINNSGASADNAVDLGDSNVRFKDLYLSGSIHNDNLKFENNAGTTEYARFDSSNNFLVGGTNLNPIGNHVSQVIMNAANGTGIHRDGGTPLKLGTDGNREILIFHITGADVGSIDVSGTSTSYTTSSDHRLKTDVQVMTGATDRLKQLNPVNFEWIADGTRVDGFLAHEAQAVVPEAITGTHNEVDDNGNPVYQGIDQSKLVPLLVATIKELEARITALENA